MSAADTDTPGETTRKLASLSLSAGVFLTLGFEGQALEIEIDYRYDVEGFFSAAGNPQGADGAAAARATLRAAADRIGAIIDQPLLAAEFSDDADDPRVRFIHPGTGLPIEVSPAASRTTDSLVVGDQFIADEYRGSWSIAADTIILYAGAYFFGEGGEDVEEVGNASTGFGENFIDVIDNPIGPLNRGFPHPFPNGDRDNLPVWGGSVSFTTNQLTTWHFDHNATPPPGAVDLYTIALHEIAHVLGQNTREWNNWFGHVTGFEFLGPETLAVIAAGNPIPEINDGADPHWFAGTASSSIFSAGSPNYTGTVGPAGTQISLMLGNLPFRAPLLRYEVTVLDAASLRDIGWSTISSEVFNQPPVANDILASIPANAAIGAAVATVDASDPDPGDTLGYAITSGNVGGAFAIDSSGNITTATALDDEVAASYSLTVKVTDSGGLSATATVGITITNVPTPVAKEVTEFKIAGNFAPGTVPSLSWAAQPGARFTVLTSTNLRDWSPVTPDLIAKGDTATWKDGEQGFEDPNPPASEVPQKYYRLISQPTIDPVVKLDVP